MAIQKIDELNNINSFFKVMELPDEEIRKREEMAWELFDLFLLLFTDVKAYIENKVDEIPVETLKNETSTKYIEIVNSYYSESVATYPVIEEYITYIVSEIIETTIKNVKKPIDTPNNPPTTPINEPTDYWISPDRAEIVAETETNTISNSIAYEEALASGKTTKTWITMQDEKVRNSHAEVDRETILIDEYFEVGGAKMKYPHDVFGEGVTPDLIINCRCVCEYS